MSEATAEFKESNVPRLGRPLDLASVLHHSFEIALNIAMEMPIRRIEGHLDFRDDARRFIDLGEHHQAISSGTLNPAHVMIGCAQPSPSLLDDCEPPLIHFSTMCHTAVPRHRDVPKSTKLDRMWVS